MCIRDSTSFPQTTMIYRKGALDLSENYELTLFILTGENANYSGMARQYRTFLGLEEEAVSYTHLDVYKRQAVEIR